jgi:hypothetical protein
LGTTQARREGLDWRLQSGYGWQLASQWLADLEADFDISDGGAEVT